METGKRVEKFIQDCTMSCSNELGAIEGIEGTRVISYNEWLTPDQARYAVEIAREEMIEKVCMYLNEHRNGVIDDEYIINLNKAMKDE